MASGCIGAGGVIRDEHGKWISGFSVNLGMGQVLDAECWGLYFGLKLAVAKGLSKLIVELDSAVAVQLIHKADHLDCHPLAPLINSCCDLMKQVGDCVVHHIYREINCVADRLANWSHNLDLGVCVLDIAPPWASDLLDEDLIGIPRARLFCS
ncbi:hypothetical protein CerSpe_174700 [Prunus speciosa]